MTQSPTFLHYLSKTGFFWWIYGFINNIDASISLQKHCGSSPQLQFLTPHIHINLNA